MTQSNDSAALMQKADRALASARLLLDAGDTDGACNRAYYAMFDAARHASKRVRNHKCKQRSSWDRRS